MGERLAGGWAAPGQRCLFPGGGFGAVSTPQGRCPEPCVPSRLPWEPFSFLSPLPLAAPGAVSGRLGVGGKGHGVPALRPSPGHSDRPAPQNRQMKHISAEQKRRFNIKMGFNTLNGLISNNSKLVSCPRAGAGQCRRAGQAPR